MVIMIQGGPEVEQEVVDNNSAAGVDSSNSDINHTSTSKTTSTSHRTTNDIINAYPISDKEDYTAI